jgi:hypothetical protein
MRSSYLPLTFAALFALAACGKDRELDDVTTNDTALARDLTMASVDSVQPALRDIPATVEAPPQVEPPRVPTPRPQPKRQNPPPPKREPVQVAEAPKPQAEQPAPAPAATVPAAAPAPRGGAIASGTALDLVADTRACTNGSRPGDKIVARLAHGVVGSNGVLLPVGSEAVVEVAEVTPGDDQNPARITFRVRSITANGVTYEAAGEGTPAGELERQRIQSGTSDKKKVIGGAIAGAILGQMIGKDTKGTIIGAAAGAAAGTVAAKAGAKYEACMPAGSTVRLTLSQPIQIAG